MARRSINHQELAGVSGVSGGAVAGADPFLKDRPVRYTLKRMKMKPSRQLQVAALFFAITAACGASPATGDSPDGDSKVDPISGVGAGLVARSDGSVIGYVMDLAEYAVDVWDTENGVRFSVNTITGFLVGGGGYYFESDNCTGTSLYGFYEPWCLGEENGAPRGLYEVIFSPGTAPGGWSRPPNLQRRVLGTARRVVPHSRDVGSGCEPYNSGGNAFCLAETEEITFIPLTFDLPITVGPP